MIDPYYEEDGITIYHGDARHILPSLAENSIDCCVTSPPYFHQRDYGVDGQIGLETSVSDYVAELVAVFVEVFRVVNDGTLWLNIGDKWNNYNGNSGPSGMTSRKNSPRPALPSGFGLECKDFKPKDLLGIPWRVAFALQDSGWTLRSDIIWSKPSPIPESVSDRPTSSHEHLFLLANSQRYYFDFDSWKERGVDGAWRNRRDVWTVRQSSHSDHKATYPRELIEPAVIAGSSEGGTVLDPFLGTGTTLDVCRRFGRKCIGIEINEEYCQLSADRLRQKVLAF